MHESLGVHDHAQAGTLMLVFCLGKVESKLVLFMKTQVFVKISAWYLVCFCCFCKSL